MLSNTIMEKEISRLNLQDASISRYFPEEQSVLRSELRLLF